MIMDDIVPGALGAVGIAAVGYLGYRAYRWARALEEIKEGAEIKKSVRNFLRRNKERIFGRTPGQTK